MEKNILVPLPLSSFKIFNIHDIHYAKRRRERKKSPARIMKSETIFCLMELIKNVHEHYVDVS